jgi:hypothetical protein
MLKRFFKESPEYYIVYGVSVNVGLLSFFNYGGENYESNSETGETPQMVYPAE